MAKLYNKKFDKKKIIKIAYEIERKRLGLDGGWQDQIISTYGGIRKISINKAGKFFFDDPMIMKNFTYLFIISFF